MAEHADKHTVRLSLILSGAISLGAYEAGVVAQLAYALGRWNEQRPAEPPHAIIDVIAGASAGAITGSMLGCHIMWGTDPALFVRIMHAQWCNTTFEQMLDPNKIDPHAILSARDIDSNGSGLFDDKAPFLDPQGDPIKPGRAYFNDLTRRPGDPARVRQEELIFTCTLTSLNAIPFQYAIDASDANVEGDDCMVGLTRKDFVTFSLANQNGLASLVELPAGATRADDRARQSADWERMFWVSAASSAFPAAWEPLILSRPNSDFLPPWGDQAGYAHLPYSDGGILNNLPFKRASDALDQFVHPPLPGEERLYIIIEPEPDKAKGSADRFQDQPPRRDTETPLLTVLNKTLEALREQSFNMDALEAQKVNRRLKAREAFFPQLLADAVNGLATEELVKQRADQVQATLQAFLDQRPSKHRAETILEEYAREYDQESSIAKAEERLLQQFMPPDAPDTRRRLFLLQLALLDCAADLRNKYPICFLRIHPENPEDLAGEILGHFGGLLSADFLRHDFGRGLDDAFARLQRLADLKGWEKPARVLDAMPEYAVDPSVAELAKRPYEQLPAEIRERFTDLLIDRMLTFIGNEANFDSLKGGPVRAMLRAYLDHVVFPE